MKTSTIKIERSYFDDAIVPWDYNFLSHLNIPQTIHNLRLFSTRTLLIVEFDYEDDEPVSKVQ